ncbi:MAG: hypothetical protein KKD39_08265 [Candidatus Altiarchaeota archaeon]|nr:hypothetical protein [Candidatus Altiarchaeota archaeon]
MLLPNLNNHKIKTLVATSNKYATPFFILDEVELNKRCEQLKNSFYKRYPKTHVFYAYKANCIPHLLHTIHSHGFGAEVSSGLELQLATKLNVKNTVFNGPGKTNAELTYALKKKAMIVVDNLDELKKILSLQTPSLKIALRLSPPYLKNKEWSRFGLQRNHLDSALGLINKNDVCLEGVHFHLGSELTDSTKHSKAIKWLSTLIKSTLHDFKDEISFVDVGGGFGVHGSAKKTLMAHSLRMVDKFTGSKNLEGLACTSPKKVEDIDGFAENICAAFTSEIVPQLGEIELWIEPGRWIINPCIHMISSVVAVKNKSAVLDVGINNLPNCIYEQYPCINLTRPSDEKKKISLFGPLCMSNDKISTTLQGDLPREGDKVCVCNVGAYNIPWSSQFIQPLAKVVASNEKTSKIIRVEEGLDYRIGRDNI